MTDETYEFDPESLDGPDEVTLDNWKPSTKSNKLKQSLWRKEQIGEDYNQHPGYDDVKRIESYIKRWVPDAEIMEYFGITAETLVAIKSKKYCPVEGIALDDLDKIHKEFKRVDNKLNKVQNYINMICEEIFPDCNWKEIFAVYVDEMKKAQQAKYRDNESRRKKQPVKKRQTKPKIKDNHADNKE